jgi:3-deoxy-D-manno-octulosonic-acid transferase
MRFVYTLLAYLLAPIVIGVMLWRGLRDRSYWQNLGERFGFGLPPERGDCIWVHAVSVGEVQASAALVRSLRERFPELPIVLTTVTPTGAERARAQFGDLVHVRFVPYDLPGSVRRFFDRVQPRLAIILETELWPNLYNECGRRGVPLVLASARISPRSVDRYRRLASLFRETLSHGIVIAAQSEGDAERFRSIGANPTRTHVTGNIKFDVSLPTDIASVGAGLRAAHAGARLVWVAGSTHAGEEETRAGRAARAGTGRSPAAARAGAAPSGAIFRRGHTAAATRRAVRAPLIRCALHGRDGRAARRYAWRTRQFLRGLRRGFRRRQPRADRRPQPARARSARRADPDWDRIRSTRRTSPSC